MRYNSQVDPTVYSMKSDNENQIAFSEIGGLNEQVGTMHNIPWRLQLPHASAVHRDITNVVAVAVVVVVVPRFETSERRSSSL